MDAPVVWRHARGRRDPIRRDLGKVDYQVRPAGTHLHHTVYRVQGVSGCSPGRVLGYPTVSELDLAGGDGRSCHVYRKLVGKNIVSYLSPHDAELPPRRQTLLLDLLCTNGDLPSGLRAGDINSPREPFEHLDCRSLTTVTEPVSIALSEDLRRRLVKHLSLTQRELTSLKGLRDTIDLYNSFANRDLQAAQAHEQLLDSLVAAEDRVGQHRYEGVPVWGRATSLTVDESAFGSAGELYLLGCVLNEFVALLAPVNYYSELEIRLVRSKEVIRWQKRLGRLMLPSS